MGLDRLRWAITGAAPISPDLIQWYLSMGVDMFEAYGQTECSAVATANKIGNAKLGTVGQAIPGSDVEISAEGEILIKSPGVFLGYFNQPDKTAETVGTFFATDENIELIKRLKDIGVKTHEEKKTQLPFQGKKFVFTGGLSSISRPDASDLVKQVGGIVSSSVGKDIDYVVAGGKPGSKYEKAEK